MDNLQLLKSRHSVRAYSPQPIDPDILKTLEAEVTMINTHEAGMHFQIITGDEQPFRGFTRSYGMLRGVRNYLAAVVDVSFADYQERAGYYAQQFVTKATELGIATCFVGGTYDARVVKCQLRKEWKIMFLVVFGYADEANTSWLARFTKRKVAAKRMSAEDFFLPCQIKGYPGPRIMYSLEDVERVIPGFTEAMEAVACAPSALNRQPVRISLNAEGLPYARVVKGLPDSLVDLGIAKFNFQYVLPGIWNWGNDSPFYPVEYNE